MSLFHDLLTIGVSCGLAYLGKKQNDEANLKIEQTKTLISNYNYFVNSYKYAIEEKEKCIINMTEKLGRISSEVALELIDPYVKILNNNFINFEATLSKKLCKFDNLDFADLNEIKNSIDLIKSNYTKSNNGADTKKVLAVSLGTFGIGATVGTIAGSTLSSLLPITSSLGLINFVPISFGVGCSVIGFLNNYKAQQSYDEALANYNELIKKEPMLKNAIQNLDNIIRSLGYYGERSCDIFNSYATELGTFIEKTKDENSSFYSNINHKIDASKLSLDDQKYLRYIYIYSRIIFSILDIPLFSKKGVFLSNSKTKLNQKCEFITTEQESYYGKKVSQ